MSFVGDILRNVLNTTPEELRDMAADVDERAADLAWYGDPRDYGSPYGLTRHVRRLEKAAEILYRLAELMEGDPDAEE
ncbi:MAG TPA: hypothetical protein VIK75_00330 [Calditerricola sp.]